MVIPTLTLQRFHQAGYMLLEALVAILVFAIGVLGIVSLQAVSVKNVGAAKFRTDASALANQLIARMWVSDRSGTNLQTQFQGGPQSPTVSDGAAYTAWLGDASTPGTVLYTLPGAAGNPPVVTVVCQPDPSCAPPLPPATSMGTRQIAITIRWQMPGETVVHSYAAVAELNAVNN